MPQTDVGVSAPPVLTRTNLRAVREAAGKTQIELAVAAGVGRTTVQNAEGRLKVTTDATMRALAAALGVEYRREPTPASSVAAATESWPGATDSSVA